MQVSQGTASGAGIPGGVTRGRRWEAVPEGVVTCGRPVLVGYGPDQGRPDARGPADRRLLSWRATCMKRPAREVVREVIRAGPGGLEKLMPVQAVGAR